MICSNGLTSLSKVIHTITDFALGEDHLDISQLLPTENTMSDLLEHITIEKVDNGGGDKDLVITISEGGSNSGQTQTIVLDNTGNQFDSVNAQGDGSVISSDLSNLVNQLFVNLPDTITKKGRKALFLIRRLISYKSL